MIKLPHDFELRMQDMLQEAYPAFLHSYDEKSCHALRVNTLKGTADEFMDKALFSHLEKIPWEKSGFYYGDDSQPGKHPLHEAGAYYIQEPSAMVPAVYLGAKPGERILDLCAAPGGKTAQIASYMQGRGLLICNEIHPLRAKTLSENVERMGIRNALVTNAAPRQLSEFFSGYFDRILVDAPCSGEGMFRKNEEACGEWSLENVRMCAARQDEILDCADLMLRPGGRLVYSTCTFAPAENEGSAARFLQRHPDYELVEIQKYDGMSDGVPQWADGTDALKRTARLFPHLVKGEGHFLAVFQKAGGVTDGYQGFLANGVQKGITVSEVPEFGRFQEETLCVSLAEKGESCLLKFGQQLYMMPEGMPSINKITVLRPGLHLGTLKKERFEPSHALALALGRKDVRRHMELKEESAARAYLRGMTLGHEGEKGWYLMTYMGYSIGWGKLAGQIMKNHYPKGKRK